MALVEYAEKELRAAGWFNEDSDYRGSVGPAVLEMVKKFAEEGHSGASAGLCLHLFRKLAAFQPLTPLANPMETGEFHDVSGPSGTIAMSTLQSTRLSTLFSEDSGKTWYDLDKKLSSWRRWLRKAGLPVSHRAYVTFPYTQK